MLYIEPKPIDQSLHVSKGLLTRLSKRRRALLGASIAEGTLEARFSNERLAVALGISTTAINAAVRLSAEERQKVRMGERPLIRRNRPVPAATLSAAWDSASADERAALIRAHEPEIWSALEVATAA
jgi:hypothetical protein